MASFDPGSDICHHDPRPTEVPSLMRDILVEALRFNLVVLRASSSPFTEYDMSKTTAISTSWRSLSLSVPEMNERKKKRGCLLEALQIPRLLSKSLPWSRENATSETGHTTIRVLNQNVVMLFKSQLWSTILLNFI